jgi:hypothetical protein
MKEKKGQVSIEYLINYGWALIVLAVVIAAMLASGAFNPGNYMLEECYFGSAFKCVAQAVSTNADTYVNLNLTNTLGYPIKLANITITQELASGGTQTISSPLGHVVKNAHSWVGLGIHLPAYITKLSTVKNTIVVSYYVCAEEVNAPCDTRPEFLRTVTGRMTAQAAYDPNFTGYS